MQQQRLNGNEHAIKIYDKPISKYPQHPNPSSASLASSEYRKKNNKFRETKIIFKID